MKISANFIVDVVKLILKYVLPIVCAYVEGDSHVIQDMINNLF